MTANSFQPIDPPAPPTQPASRVATPSDWLIAWREDPFETALLAGLIGGLAWAPFWLGGDRPFAWGVNGLWFPSLTLAYELSLIARGRRHPFGLLRIAPSAGLFALVALWIGAQISTLLPGSFAHPIWTMAGDALGSPLDGAISVSPQQTALALLRLLTDACAFWLALQLCRARRRGYLLLQGVVVIVAAYSAYGLLLSVLYGGAIPFFAAPDMGRFVRATFVNRNNFATYAGLGLVAATALLLRLFRHEVPDLEGLRSYQLSRLIEATGARGWRLLGAGLVILAALLATVSRGGVLSTALALSVLFILSFARGERRGGQRVEAVLFVAVAVAAGFFLFGDRIVGRISETGLTDAGRLSVYAIILRALLNSPYLGFGYGAFADVFPMYRDQSISPIGVWDMAHNSYLEVLLGLGLIFGAALIMALAILVWKCLRAAVARRRNATAPIIAASAALLVGVHAMVDFSLEIEAVALTFMAILGAGVAQSESSRRATGD